MISFNKARFSEKSDYRILEPIFSNDDYESRTVGIFLKINNK